MWIFLLFSPSPGVDIYILYLFSLIRDVDIFIFLSPGPCKFLQQLDIQASEKLAKKLFFQETFSLMFSNIHEDSFSHPILDFV